MPDLCPICKKRPPHEDYSTCAVCMGIESEPSYPKTIKKVPRPYHCSACHVEQQDPGDIFYPSRKDKCKACIKANAPKTEPPAESAPIELLPATRIEEPLQNQTENIPESIPLRICTDCGTAFEEYRHGATKPGVCPECMDVRQKAGIQTKLDNRLKADDRLLIVFESDDMALLERLRELARRQRRTPEAQILVILESLMEGAT